MGSLGDILAAYVDALSAPSKRVEIEGREHLGWSSTGGERGACGAREYEK